jgi:hypothetical protein
VGGGKYVASSVKCDSHCTSGLRSSALLLVEAVADAPSRPQGVVTPVARAIVGFALPPGWSQSYIPVRVVSSHEVIVMRIRPEEGHSRSSSRRPRRRCDLASQCESSWVRVRRDHSQGHRSSGAVCKVLELTGTYLRGLFILARRWC